MTLMGKQTMGKTGRLRRLLESPELSFLIETHNGLSATIVEEAGFEGIWASGLCMSASMEFVTVMMQAGPRF